MVTPSSRSIQARQAKHLGKAFIASLLLFFSRGTKPTGAHNWLGYMENAKEDEDFWLFGYGYRCAMSLRNMLILADGSKLQEFDMEASTSLW